MARGANYKSAAKKLINYTKSLKTCEEFKDSFSENKTLDLLFKEMIIEEGTKDTKGLDPALLSSYNKLLSLRDYALEAKNIESIKQARNNFISDFEKKLKNPSDSVFKRFWQKIKNKLFSVNVSRDKYSDIIPSKKSPSNVDLSSPSNSSPLLTELETRLQKKNRKQTNTNALIPNSNPQPQKPIVASPTAPINNPSYSGVIPKAPPLPDIQHESTGQILQESVGQIPTDNISVLSQTENTKTELNPATASEVSNIPDPIDTGVVSEKEVNDNQVRLDNPTQGFVPPPPPPPPQLANLQQQTAAKTDLLAQIRQQGASRNLSKDHPNYKYVPISSKSTSSGLTFGDVFTKAMQNKTNIQSLHNSQITELLDGKSDEERLNILYSAFIDKNDQLIKDLKSYKINTSISDEDDWDTLEETNSKTITANLFTDEQFNAAQQAALETEQRIERGEDLISHQPTIDKATSQDVRDPAKAPTKSSEILDHISSHREALRESQVIGEQISHSTEAPASRVAPGTIPPPPPPVKSYATTHSPTTFLNRITNHNARNLKPSVNTQHPLSTENFTYLDENKSDLKKDTGILAATLKTRRLSVDGNKAIKEDFKKLDDKGDDQGKLNKLYSYIIDNNQANINAVLDYDYQSKKEVFLKANLEKIAKDVLIVAKRNPKSAIQIHKGLEYFATTADLDISKIEKQSISHAEQIKQERDAPNKPRIH
jgi:hypothetical protein